MWQCFGAHLDDEGAQFAVWAPNAAEVSVVGDFNYWTHGEHRLEPQGSSGVWVGRINGVQRGQRYKFSIHSHKDGYQVEKADPIGIFHEEPPKTASILWDNEYEWGDQSWMAERGAAHNHRTAPMSIYEVHPGSFRHGFHGETLNYRQLGESLAEHCGNMGFTHVELMPVMEHPFYGSWGYQVTGYFAPTARYGSPQDLMYMIDVLHQRGIGVILDWVPAHFPTDEHGLGYFDGTHLYEHADPRKGFHPDWTTYIFNYGRNEVRSFLLSSAMYWLEVFHVDALRVDGVASMLYLDYSREEGQWIPNPDGSNHNREAISLILQLNETVYREHPDVQTIAEESTAWPGVSRPTSISGLGFGFKWDMGWMHDTLQYLSRDPVHRTHHHGEITFRAIYAYTESYVLPLSHDEVVHGKGSLLDKMPGDWWQKVANLRLLLSYMYGTPGKKLLFMGVELADTREWNHENALDWGLAQRPEAQGLIKLITDLNHLYRGQRALHIGDVDEGGFVWVDHNDAHQSTLAFERLGHEGDRPVLVVCNFTPVPRHAHSIGVSQEGTWMELFNSDADYYGGSGVGNAGVVTATAQPMHGRPYSLPLTIPPLGCIYLAPGSG
jgi:1,4-alpha-glucan branching enzyme